MIKELDDKPKKKPTNRRRRRVGKYNTKVPTNRPFRFNKKLDRCGKSLLEMAQRIHEECMGLDTTVRDSVAYSLAGIVTAGYDCEFSNTRLSTEAWMGAIQAATHNWFEDRGYSDWFCVAAANGFRLSRPRRLGYESVS